MHLIIQLKNVLAYITRWCEQLILTSSVAMYCKANYKFLKFKCYTFLGSDASDEMFHHSLQKAKCSSSEKRISGNATDTLHAYMDSFCSTYTVSILNDAVLRVAVYSSIY